MRLCSLPKDFAGADNRAFQKTFRGSTTDKEVPDWIAATRAKSGIEFERLMRGGAGDDGFKSGGFDLFQDEAP